MSIQFSCPGCGQPIEVDDEFAGRRAACPYCQQVVTVPHTSTYQPEDVPTARPAEHGAPPPPDSLHVGAPPPPPRRQRTARTYANAALICAALMILLIGIMMIQLLVRTGEKLQPDTATQPVDASTITREQANQAANAAVQDLVDEPWFLAPLFASALAGIAGIAMALAALWQRAGYTWRSVLSLLVCGAYIVCVFGGEVIRGLAGVG